MNIDYQTHVFSGAQGIEIAAKLLQSGDCVALPTETVYGLAADATRDSAVARIFESKGRPTNHPLIVHLPSIEHLNTWASEVPDVALQLAEAFWPGPLTVIVNKADSVSRLVTGGLDTVALRVPSHPVFKQILMHFGGAVAAPSANRYKQLSPTTAEHVMHSLQGRIPAIIDGGACEHGLESTIVDVTGDTPRIVRAGPISQVDIQTKLGRRVLMPDSFDDVVPGNVEAHYQPRAPLYTRDSNDIAALIEEGTEADTYFLLWSKPLIDKCNCQHTPLFAWQGMPDTPEACGARLYAALFQADQTKPAQIVFERPPQTQSWRAVNDRLTRASSN